MNRAGKFNAMEAIIAQPKPYYQELKKGRAYYWCSCGRSQKQPYCDGSHKGTSFEPVKYVAPRDEDVLFCGCKQTRTGPFCDGSHNNLPGGYAADDPESPANRAIALATRMDGARTFLDGRCYIFSTADAPLQEKDGFRYCPVITQGYGARYQSQFYGELAHGRSPVMAAGGVPIIVFVAAGDGMATISGTDFAVRPGDGFYVAPDEAFALSVHGDTPLQLFISACPAAEDLTWAVAMPDNFHHDWPRRVVGIDPARRHAMAARYFQMLVDKTVGSAMAAQFIGHIPRSKAMPHRHLYEEALIILSGHGMMWTDDVKAPVKPGDVIFLPAKQIHSLEATTDQGLDVVGVIYPGDNPSINY